MEVEKDLEILQSVLSKDINNLLLLTLANNKTTFIKDILKETKRHLPELAQAFEYLQLEKREDMNMLISPDHLIRATNIHHTIKIAYDSLCKNDLETLKFYFKGLDIKKR